MTTKIDLKKLGAAIREIRELRGLTQREVAERMNLSVNFLSMVENGKRGISIEHLNELAEILDVPTSFITFLGSTAPRNNKLAAGLMGEIQELVRNAIGVQAPETALAHA